MYIRCRTECTLEYDPRQVNWFTPPLFRTTDRNDYTAPPWQKEAMDNLSVRVMGKKKTIISSNFNDIWPSTKIIWL